MVFPRTLAAITRPVASLNARCLTPSIHLCQPHIARALYTLTPFEKAAMEQHGDDWKSTLTRGRAKSVAAREASRKKWLQKMREEHGDNWEAVVQASDKMCDFLQESHWKLKKINILADDTRNAISGIQRLDRKGKPQTTDKPASIQETTADKSLKQQAKRPTGADFERIMQARHGDNWETIIRTSDNKTDFIQHLEGKLRQVGAMVNHVRVNLRRVKRLHWPYKLQKGNKTATAKEKMDNKMVKKDARKGMKAERRARKTESSRARFEKALQKKHGDQWEAELTRMRLRRETKPRQETQTTAERYSAQQDTKQIKEKRDIKKAAKKAAKQAEREARQLAQV